MSKLIFYFHIDIWWLSIAFSWRNERKREFKINRRNKALYGIKMDLKRPPGSKLLSIYSIKVFFCRGRKKMRTNCCTFHGYYVWCEGKRKKCNVNLVFGKREWLSLAEKRAKLFLEIFEWRWEKLRWARYQPSFFALVSISTSKVLHLKNSLFPKKTICAWWEQFWIFHFLHRFSFFPSLSRYSVHSHFTHTRAGKQQH